MSLRLILTTLAIAVLPALLGLGCGGSGGGPAPAAGGAGGAGAGGGGTNPPAALTQTLGVVITRPLPQQRRVVSTATITLEGTATGNPTAMAWTTRTDAGVITPGASWSAEIPLVEGDNLIVVRAERGAEQATATVFVMRDPNLLGVSRLRIVEPGGTVGQTSDHHVELDIQSVRPPTQVELHEWDLGLTASQGVVATLHDDGWLGNDELFGDGRFTGTFQLAPTERDVRVYRAHIVHPSGAVSYSCPVLLTITEALTRPVLSACLDAQQGGLDAYNAARAGGADHDAARAAALAVLAQDPQVADAGLAGPGGGLWIVFKAGFGGGLMLGAEGTRGGDSACGYRCERSAAFGDAFPDRFPASELEHVRTRLGELQCPGWAPLEEYRALDATVLNAALMTQRGLVMYASHGDTWYDTGGPESATDPTFGYYTALGGFERFATWWDQRPPQATPRPVVFTRQAVTLDQLEAAENYLRMAHLVMGQFGGDGKTYFALTPAWFRQRNLDGRIVYVGACQSAHTGELAEACLGSGAFAFVGYDDYITHEYATQQGTALFDGLLAGQSLFEAYDIGNLPQDPETGGIMVVYSGPPMDEVYLPLHEMVNPGFEDGRVGWYFVRGSTSIESRLGDIRPPELPTDECKPNRLFAKIGTGGGDNRMTQDVCIPGDSATLRFRWNVVGRQFMELCGFGGGDIEFEVTVGPQLVLNFTTEDLCDSGNLTPVDAAYEENAGNADGLTWMTGWREHRYVIEGWGGEVLPLSFRVLSVDAPPPCHLLVDCIELIRNDD